MSTGQMTATDILHKIVDDRTVEMMVTASRDPSCLGRTKYIYRFNDFIGQSIIQAFRDCETKVVSFSKIIPHSNDLFKVRKENEFQADIVVGGLSATVYFVATDQTTLKRSLGSFGRRLREAGYRHINYVTAQSANCDRCPVNHLKKCSS